MSLLITPVIVLFGLIDAVTARTIRRPFQLVLSHIHAASLALAIFFGLGFLVFALSNAGKLGSRTRLVSSDGRGVTTYHVGLVYPFFTVLAAVSLVVYSTLYAFTIVYSLNESIADIKSISAPFAAGRDFALHIAHWFIVCALLLLLFVRETEGAKEGEPVPRRKRDYAVHCSLDAISVLGLLAAILAVAVLEGSLQTYNPEKAESFVSADRAYIAIREIVSFYVFASASWTRKRLALNSKHDSIVIGQIVKYISPLLVLSSMYQIAEYVVTYNYTVFDLSANVFDSLLLARMIVTGVTNSVILWFAS